MRALSAKPDFSLLLVQVLVSTASPASTPLTAHRLCVLLAWKVPSLQLGSLNVSLALRGSIQTSNRSLQIRVCLALLARSALSDRKHATPFALRERLELSVALNAPLAQRASLRKKGRVAAIFVSRGGSAESRRNFAIFAVWGSSAVQGLQHASYATTELSQRSDRQVATCVLEELFLSRTSQSASLV